MTSVAFDETPSAASPPHSFRVQLPRSRELLSEGVRRRIQDAILDGTLLPGERLHDEELIQWLGVSRTPIRSALDRLREAGLVELSPHRFTRVAVVTAGAVVDALQILAALHAAAARAVVPSLDDAAVAEFRALRRAVPVLPELALDRRWSRHELHPVNQAVSLFSRRAENPLSAEVIGGIEKRLALGFRSLAVSIDGQRVATELDLLGDAVDRRDGDDASEAIGRLVADHLVRAARESAEQNSTAQ